MTVSVSTAARNQPARTAIFTARKMRSDLTGRENAMDEDPIVNSLIYALLFICMLEFWLATGTIQ
jgi:hypothetical protein